MAPPFSDTRWDTFGLLKEAYLALDQRFAEVTERIVPVDRSVADRRLDDATMAEVRRRFERHMTPDGARFVRPMRVNLLRRRG